jgi:hypothetical protein
MFEKESPSHEYTIKLTMRQLSLAMAALLAFSFFVFIAGYFLGQKKAAEEFSFRADQDSLADQIYSSMCVLYDAKDESEDASESDSGDEVELNEMLDSAEPKDDRAHTEIAHPAVPQKQFIATIAGFGSGNCAEGKKLVQQLISKGYPVELVERSSKTAKGKTVIWYQIITKPYASKDSLELAIRDIAKLAHVKEKSISIRECA